MRGASEAGQARRTRLTAERRRETILEAATAVFAASGYRAGKVSDVAARIGVTEPVIFQNFGSKAALFAAVLDRVAEEVGASLDDLAGYHEPAGGLLARILGRAGGPAHEPSHGPSSEPSHGPSHAPPHGPSHGPSDGSREPSEGPSHAPPHGPPHGPKGHHALFGDAAALIADPEAGEAAARVARVVAGHLADLVRRGQRDGSVRADVDPAAAAWLLLSVLSTRQLRAGAGSGAGLEPDVDGLALRAILAPGPAGPAGPAHPPG